MPDTFRGLAVPPGLTKENYRKVRNRSKHPDKSGYCTLLSAGYGTLTRCGCVDRSGKPTMRCVDCICLNKHRKDLERLMKYWDSEDCPIEQHMVVKYLEPRLLLKNEINTTHWMLVQRVEQGKLVGYNIFRETGNRSREALVVLGEVVTVPMGNALEAYAIEGGYLPSRDDIFELWMDSRIGKPRLRLVWRKPTDTPLELTIEDLEKQYGRKIKIVGGSKE